MTYRIIDTIAHERSWTFRYPNLEEEYGEGVQVILDPQQVREAPSVAGQRIQVVRPDGIVGEFNVAVVDVNPDGVVSLFLPGVDKRDVPRGSTVKW